MAVNPVNPAQVVVAAIDYNSTPPHIAVFPSSDDGHSFPQAVELWTPAGKQNSADPGLAFDRDGHLYASYLTQPGGVVVARSDDGGRSWPVHLLVGGSQSCSEPDFPSIATAGSTVYVAWQQVPTASCTEQPQLRIATSRDQGRSWSAPLDIPTPAGELSEAPRLSAGPVPGHLAISYKAISLSQPVTTCPPDYGFDVMVDTSSDGTHFHQSVLARSVCNPASVDTGQALNQNHDIQLSPFDPPYGGSGGVPAPVFDARTGVIVVAAAYSDASQIVSTHFYASADQGLHWHPTGLVRTPGSQQLMPFLAAGADGAICLNWIAQFPGAIHLAMAAVSHDDGATWSAPEQLASQPSYGDFGAAGNWLGDYIGDAIGPDGLAHPVWTDTRSYPAQPNGPYQEIWTRSIST